MPMKEELFFVERMERRGVKPTAMRLLIFRTLFESGRALSLGELEQKLDTVDKSTIFRTLTLFLSRHLVHGLEDGSGSLKYEVCAGGSSCSLEDMHVHFYCVQCQRTFCFKQQQVPLVDLPEGYAVQSINYMMKGVCPTCAVKKEHTYILPEM